MQEQPGARQLKIEALCVCCAVLQLFYRLADEYSVVHTLSICFALKVWQSHMYDDDNADFA